MFGNKKEEVNYDNFDTLIGKDTVFEGKIKATGTIRIEGIIKGDIVTAGDVVLAESGKIDGNIEARNILVAGVINGLVKASQKIELASTGKLYGDITVKALVIDDGAIFEGKCLMDKTSKELKENNKVS